MIFVDQSHYLDAVSIEIFQALSSRNLKVQFILSHDPNSNSVNLTSFLDFLQTVPSDRCLSISSTTCTKEEVSRYLKASFESKELFENVRGNIVDLVIEITKGIPLLIIQLIDRYHCLSYHIHNTTNNNRYSCIQSHIKHQSGNL